MKLTQRSPSAPWQVHFKGKDGDRVRLSTGERDHALARVKALDLMREHLVECVPVADRDSIAITVNLSAALSRSYETRWKLQKSAKEKKYLIGALAREIGHWPLPSITKKRLADWGAEKLAAKEAPATVNRKMSAIHTAMSDADVQPMPKFPQYAENNVTDRYVSDDEEAAILKWYADNTAPADLEGAYMAALIPLLLDTGMRGSEALELTPRNILPNGSLHLRHGTTKSGKGRSVPLTARARASLAVVMASPLHGTWEIDKAGRRFRLVVEKLKIAEVTLHTLRHTCASRLVQAGFPLISVRDWMGHSSITITERYAHLAPTSMEGGVALLEARNAPTVPPQPTTLSQGVCNPSDLGTHLEGIFSGIRGLDGAKGETRSCVPPAQSRT